MKPSVSLLYVYYNTPDELAVSIASIPDAIGKLSYEIIIIDNHSDKKIPTVVKTKKNITIIKNTGNKGYGPALNQGAKLATGKYLFLLNPDTVFKKNAIRLMLDKMQKDRRIGILGPKLVDGEGTTLKVGSGIPSPLHVLFAFSFLNKLFPGNMLSKRYWLRDMDRNKTNEPATIAGACMLVRRDIFTTVSGFDEQFFMYFEEADLCLRIKALGYKVLYYPKAEIVHFIGRSNKDKNIIKELFQRSRFLFLKKYYGVTPAILVESFIRIGTLTNLVLLSILGTALFLNEFKIDPLMLFISDMGRDYLAARDMILTHQIPLVGIRSSVVWLHQGPLSVYLIGLGLVFGRFNPVAPAIFYGLLGVLTTYIVYFLGKHYCNAKTGLFAAAFYATSPFVVVNTRMPYHTSIIPLFTSLFFLCFYFVLHGKRRLLSLLFFLLGLALQTELSNGVIFFILFVLYVLFRPRIGRGDTAKSFLGFLFGILPFIIYDFSHNFVQTLGFPLWIINRIRLFFGLTLQHNSTTVHASGAIVTIWNHLARIIFPSNQFVVIGILLFVSVILFVTRKTIFTRYPDKNLITILLWFCIPVIGFTIHAAPASAYFPLLFAPISLLIAYAFSTPSRISKLLSLVFLCIIVYNALFLVGNDFFVGTYQKSNPMPPDGYNFGSTYKITDDVAKFIVSDAKGKEFSLSPGGYLRTFPTSLDNYKYLLWYRGGKYAPLAPLSYTIYEDKHAVPAKEAILFTNKYVFVTKHEK